MLTSGISGSEYATHLLDVARESAQCRHPWSPAIAIAHHSMLEGRVRAMLNARVNREPLTDVVPSDYSRRARRRHRVDRRRDPIGRAPSFDSHGA